MSCWEQQRRVTVKLEKFDNVRSKWGQGSCRVKRGLVGNVLNVFVAGFYVERLMLKDCHLLYLKERKGGRDTSLLNT